MKVNDPTRQKLGTLAGEVTRTKLAREALLKVLATLDSQQRMLNFCVRGILPRRRIYARETFGSYVVTPVLNNH